jgi:hypothetical protein
MGEARKRHSGSFKAQVFVAVLGAATPWTNQGYFGFRLKAA